MPGAAAKQGHTHPHIQPDRQTTQTDNHNHSHPPHSPSVKPGGSLVRSVLVPSTKGALAMVKAPRCTPLKPSTLDRLVSGSLLLRRICGGTGGSSQRQARYI